MEKSVETIWKEGFLKNENHVIPKLNDLYNQKSKHTIDELMKMGRVNLIAIVAGAFLILFASMWLGVTFAGLILFGLLIWLVIYGRSQGGKIEAISKSLSSYEYLKEVDLWLKKTIDGYVKINRVFYPAFLLTFVFGWWSSEMGKDFICNVFGEVQGLYAVNGIPLSLIILALVVACIMSLFAGRIYKWDLCLVYGPVFNKLKELIFDMEELRGDKV